MSAESKEISHIIEMKKEGGGHVSTMFVSPPITSREWDAISPGPNKQKFTARQYKVLKKINELSVLSKVALLTDEIEIGGKKGSILIYDKDVHSESITELAAHIGAGLSVLRGEESFQLSLNPIDN